MESNKNLNDPIVDNDVYYTKYMVTDLFIRSSDWLPQIFHMLNLAKMIAELSSNSFLFLYIQRKTWKQILRM